MELALYRLILSIRRLGRGELRPRRMLLLVKFTIGMGANTISDTRALETHTNVSHFHNTETAAEFK